MKSEMCQQILDKSSNIKLHAIRPVGSEVFPCGQTDKNQLMVAFRNFKKAPKKNNQLFFPTCVPQDKKLWYLLYGKLVHTGRGKIRSFTSFANRIPVFHTIVDHYIPTDWTTSLATTCNNWGKTILDFCQNNRVCCWETNSGPSQYVAERTNH
jgi:hypothetical protein